MECLKNKRLFLLDMDGTIYLDTKLFDGTKEFLKYVKDIGGRYMRSEQIHSNSNLKTAVFL